MTLPLPLHERPGHPCKAENDDPQSPKVMEALRKASERRTREMNAELPDDVRELLKLKGMI